MLRQTKENVQGTNSDAKETGTQINDVDQKEERNIQAEDGIRDLGLGLVGSEMCIRDRAMLRETKEHVQRTNSEMKETGTQINGVDQKNCLLYTSDAADDR